MTPQELKNSILQLAIQGKLVEQRTEEGTGEELYQQIQEEKQRLIKAGTIKKEKPLPEISEDEIPFDIPESWKWVRFSDVLDVRDGTHDTPKYVTSGIPLVTSKNLVDGHIDFETTKLISAEDAQIINMRSAVDDGDILFAMIGTIGNPVLVKKHREFCIKNMALFKAINNKLIDMQYFMLFIQNEQQTMKKKASGGVQSFVSLSFLRNYLLPFPPLSEQKRIVAKIEELLPYIDRYEKAWSKLEDFNKRFPVDMQKSILQMAIQGKLVEQRTEEGTGEELYQQIQAEKQSLIKSGVIKKEKPLPEITDSEIPFDVPNGWKWVRLKEIATKITDGTHHSPPNSEIGDYMYVTAKNIKEPGVMLSNITYVTEGVHAEIFARCNPELGDILLIKDGATTGVVTVNNVAKPFSMLSSVALLKMPKNICAWYLVYVLRSDLFYKTVRAQMKGTGITRITLKQIEPMVVPLPPLAEQKRIVAKLEEILPLCERLK